AIAPRQPAAFPPLSDKAALTSYLEDLPFAIKCGSNLCDIRENRIDLRSSGWGGIRTSGYGTVVDGNLIEAVFNVEQDVGLPAGIYCTAPANSFDGAHRALLRDNVLKGPQAGITISRCNEVEVSGNHLDGAGH